MKQVWWWLKGWRRVYSTIVCIDNIPGFHWGMLARDTFPNSMKEEIERRGGEDNVKVVGAVFPHGMPYVNYEVWAKTNA
jgi:hypothetical protein